MWNTDEHKQEDVRTNGDCCFNIIIGLPQKDGNDKPLYDYEEIIFDSLVTHNNKHFWIKKATGLGVSEFMLRFMAWLCLKDNALSGSLKHIKLLSIIIYYSKSEITSGHQITQEILQEMSRKMQVEWRRRHVFELSSKGQSHTEIARKLQISESTISKDLDHLRQQAKTNRVIDYL
jgi:DNA-binding NarL/FixJ family response regulator